MSGNVALPALAPVVRLAGRGWGWWTGELAALVPSPLRPRDRRPKVTIRLGAESVTVERTVEDEQQILLDPHGIDTLDDESWSQLREFTAGAVTEIVLAPPECFTTSVRLPRAARGRLRAAVALQLSEIAPLDPDALIWSTHAVAVDGDTLTAKVTMARRMRVEALGALFGQRGLPVPAIAAAADDDFVPLIPGDTPPRGRGNRRNWVIASALLVSIPVTVTVVAAILTANADDDNTRLGQIVTPKVIHDRQARNVERARLALAPLVAQPAATTILARLAATLPRSSFIQSIEGHANRLDLTLDTSDPEAAQAVLHRDPLFAQLRLQGATPGDDGRSELRLSGPLAGPPPGVVAVQPTARR